jgi:hypothetical protein
MRRVDLEADRLVAPRDDRERQADGEDGIVEEVPDGRVRLARIADE